MTWWFVIILLQAIGFVMICYDIIAIDHFWVRVLVLANCSLLSGPTKAPWSPCSVTVLLFLNIKEDSQQYTSGCLVIIIHDNDANLYDYRF